MIKHGKENFGAAQYLHIKFNGVQCRQPAMRHKKYCHFHDCLHERSQMPGGERFQLPIAEDTASIQLSINQVMRALMCHHIDTKTASTLLYALQLSTTNLMYYDREVFPPPPPEKEEEQPSLAKLLLEKLREDCPSSFSEEDHQTVFNKPHPNPVGMPAQPVASTVPVSAEVSKSAG